MPTSLHVVNGAAVLVTCWLLTLRAWRASRPTAIELIAAESRAHTQPAAAEAAGAARERELAGAEA